MDSSVCSPPARCAFNSSSPWDWLRHRDISTSHLGLLKPPGVRTNGHQVYTSLNAISILFSRAPLLLASVREREGSGVMSAASLTLRWVQGFPKQNIGFINNNTVCYPCGNYLIFINIETEKRSVLQCMNGKVGAIATNIPFQAVAFSDRKLKPNIYVYTFPELSRKAKLKGHAQLDYTSLEFSYCGTYLASYSAVPEYELILWNWEKKVMLCNKLQPGMEVSQMTFNPMNWHQLCLSSPSALSIWNIERNDKNYHLKSKSVNLPAEDGAYIYDTDGMVSCTEFKDTLFGPSLFVSSIAGLVGVEAETFKPKDDFHPLLHPTIHCWNATNELYVGCEEGHILLINAESLLVTILSRSPKIHSKDTSVNTMAFHKEGLFVSGNDGIVHSFTIKEMHYRVKDHFDVQEPVGSIIFSPDYTLLLIETLKGSVYTYTFGEEPKVKKILDAYGGNIQTIDFITPGNKYCMSVTILGEICIWLLENGSQVSKLHLRTEVNDMACCPSSLSVAMGTSTGYIHFLDVTDIELPQVVHKVFLTRSSIQHVHYDQKGQYLITGTSDGYIFILNAKPSQSFKVLGFTEMNGNIVQMSTVYISETKLVEVMVLIKTSKSEKSKLEMFSLPEATLTDPDNCCDERGRLKNDIIERRLYEVNYSLTSAILDSHSEQIYGYCGHVPYICSYGIPEKDSKVVVLKADIKMQSRHFGTGILCLSSHGKWLASTAKDGMLSIRDSNNLETFAQTPCHSYQGQGIQSMAFSLDGRFILVNGREDGAFVCLRWKKIPEYLAQEAAEHFQTLLDSLNSSIVKENSALLYMRASQLSLDSVSRQSAFSKAKSSVDSFSQDEHSGAADGANEQETTWLEKKDHEAVEKEVKEFSEKKKELKQGIRALAKTIQEMLKENDLAPQIAQLEVQEFTLDLEEMKKLYNENDKEVEKLRKETEMENLAKMYLWNVLKKECWDSMSVKGQVLMLRKHIVELHPVASSLDKKSNEEEEEEEEDEDELAKRDSSLPNYLLGSLCTSFGVDIGILNSQLELHTREEKINQIILLKDIIYKIKTTFNNEFDATFQQKQLEIARVRERNIRIQEIITDLELGEEVWQPEIEDCEKPDLVLTVEDNEIKVEKYLTPWQKEQAALAAAKELERLLLAQRNDFRRRALMEMMNGVLEVKKEDILKMEVPQPAFMLSKLDEIWTEEEMRQFKEYEKKVKELNEEKEKYKKSLDAELRKIQGSIQETTQIFDDNLRKLFERKVIAEMVIKQEELKITNLIFSLLLDEELSTRELGLNNFLERKQIEKKNTSKEVFMARDEVDAYRENYDNLVAEDKVIERGFKKEFAELSSHHAETLNKLFKRRPRLPRQRVHAESTTPFGNRLGSGKVKKDNLAQIMKAMDDLDDPHHMPEGLDPGVWQYFCAARRTKIENEQRVKQKAAGLLEMQAFLQRRIEEDEKVQMDIEKIFQEIFVLRKDKANYETDLTVQFLLKQGQVETENFHFLLDYSDSVIITRSIIEDLNNSIRAQGQKKVTNMVENKNYHKGIFQIEWEHKKMEMEMEDLNQKAWDVQMLFFSRAHQMYLQEEDHDLMIGFQISLMEQTIASIDKTHKKDVEAQKQLLKKLRKVNNLKDLANYALSCNLHEELVCIAERKHICQSIGVKLTCEKISRERYEATLQQQKLIDISKEQYELISILQAEVERLRMKTFPALIHM
ncbi:cilia- and flagella-associated protein 43-like [Dromiciops gliroides]|uniref:cilia- and flagella-associated protein 43-like n=1 Tax=Dromiciops gliroides TaxID=33562 RepID=UPI001CC649A4|nr:cilia- and flagella-associated protein 43-like [Dromiciops gliroides]